jgi:hypothetical protein
MSAPKKDGQKPKDGRDNRGRFADGNGGGPGRPKGVGRADLLKDAIGDDLPRIFDKLREQALAGDQSAIRLIVDKLIPGRRPIEEPIEMDIPHSSSLTDLGRSMLQAVGDGHLSPSQGAALVGALGQLARVAEVDELTRRIEDLEAKHEQAGSA